MGNHPYNHLFNTNKNIKDKHKVIQKLMQDKWKIIDNDNDDTKNSNSTNHKNLYIWFNCKHMGGNIITANIDISDNS